MKSRIWRLAGVGLLCVSVSAQALADEPEGRGPDGGGRGPEHQGNNQPRPQSNEIIRGDNSRQFEQNGQPPHNDGQWQNRNRPAYEPEPGRQPSHQPANNLPIQPRPDAVRQTEEPRQGYYRDERPQNGYHNQQWQTQHRPDDNRWPGRPDGHGNGWGPGPQYRPGQVIDRFPDRDYRVPYRGQDYFYSGGYWYRPQGPRYIVVQPPRGIRIQYLPAYAREVWVGGSLLFLAAGSYYAYQQATQDYIVVEPPVQQPQPQTGGYDVEAYPANGQSPQQVQQDGYQCSQYAVQQSGFDPRTATYQPAPEVVQAYRQAQGNCLSSRGYQVNY
ncbi:glycine zipper family protein [Pseudomonas sp. SWRI153]|uniref:Glycine zipper family protein n=1 Tax=Pseudomonas khorasanensis TaxID=2745508 RepID=A0A923F4I9_9PSED|nr:DUF6515 family protein [Pseudomonas khorasanensis]MBV4486693.1 glycine zipper family protein [Pseudomonas khorasanensis]